jgi:hypothetical protein
MIFTDPNDNEIIVEYIFVTPKTAAEWLERNVENNRALKERSIRDRVADLTDGAFVFNGATVKFDDGDNLIDGQHRLASIVKSGVSAHLLVVRGLGQEALPTIDTGEVTRTVSDILHVQGRDVHNETTVRSMKMVLMQGDREEYKLITNRAKVAELIWNDREILESYAEWAKRLTSLTDLYLSDQGGRTKSKKAVSPGPLAALGYIMVSNGADNDLVDQFFEAVMTGSYSEESGLENVVRKLRTYLRDSGPLVRDGGTQLPMLFRNFDTVIRTYNRWLSGEQISTIRRGGNGGGGGGIKWIDEIELPLALAEERPEETPTSTELVSTL